jgi:arylformamidase
MHVIDLTLPLSAATLIVDGDPPVTIARVRTHEADSHQVTAVSLGSHSGTHLDAPRHFFPEGATLDSYPVERLVRPGWVVDVRPRIAAPSATPYATPAEAAAPAPPARIDARLLAQRLEEVDLEPGDFLLLWTAGALLAEDAVRLLLQTGAGLVGTDAASLDEHPYPAHVLLLGAGVLLAENLANLDTLGPGRVMCAFLPLALVEADGAPMRAVAWR